MRVLHTSDWHIGRTLYDKRRHEEHTAFLSWLADTMVDRKVDLLLVCGDIFDTISPGNKSQEIYYSFLRKVIDSGCTHVVVTGGNHDSPSMLDAPKQVLESIGVHVFGSCPKEPEEEVILLSDIHGQPQAIVCAVPFLRDRDVRDSIEGSPNEKAQRLVAGIGAHYALIQEKAKAIRKKIGKDLPLIVTGHLFTTGGKIADGDGVRDLYVGTAAEVSSSLFDSEADYVALGHLHVPQIVGKRETVRYSGSPLPMGFGEANQQKQVVLVDFQPDSLFPVIETIDVPTFQKLQKISGSLEEIETQLQTLTAVDRSVWVEVSYDGTLSPSVLREHLDRIVEGSGVEILRLENIRLTDHVLHPDSWQQTLDDLDEREVFRRRLSSEDLENGEAELLTTLYEKILFSLQEEQS